MSSSADVLPTDLPSEVREHDTAKTSVFQAGQLVYDGATQQHVTPGAGNGSSADGGPGSTLSEMLAWGIKNSDPAELERRAAAGDEIQPSRLDREALDILLGQPTVAKMRACLGKVTEEVLQQPDAILPALNALEELEYYAEDLDNANDLAKIGGVQALLYCCSADRPEVELREAACGVLAACLQNNPPFVKAAVELGVPTALLRLLDEGAGGEAASARAKSLYALSALLRSSKDAAATVLASAAARRTLFNAAAEPHTRVRRRALFLVHALLRDEAIPTAAFGEEGVAQLLLSGAADADEEVREQALQVLLLLLGDGQLCEKLRAAGAASRLAEAQQSPELTEDQAQILHKLVGQLSA